LYGKAYLTVLRKQRDGNRSIYYFKVKGGESLLLLL